MTEEKAKAVARACVLLSLKLLGYEKYNDGGSINDLQMLWKSFFADEGPEIEQLCTKLLNHLGT